jgi:predicted nucleic acid-binding protein
VRVLFDTNVILDLLLDRQPHAEAAAALIARVERGELIGHICATTVTTIFYLATKVVGAGAAREQIGKLLGLFEIAPVNRGVLEGALAAGFNDFEDAVLYEAARHVGAQCIATRNVSDFKHAEMPVYLPGELEAALSATSSQY